MKTNNSENQKAPANAGQLSPNYEAIFARLEKQAVNTKQFASFNLSPFANLFALSLSELKKHYRPHDCGGFTSDDIEWRLGIGFSTDEEITGAYDELVEKNLIRYAGYDEEDGIGHCYELK